MSTRMSWLLLLFIPVVSSLTMEQYEEARNSIRRSRHDYQYGSELTLSHREKLADQIVIQLKEHEILQAIETQSFPPSRSFFESQKMIEQSKVFKIIKSMPKGAALHLHDIAMVDPSWVVKKFTYNEHCYMCMKGDGIVAFAFSRQAPASRDDCQWMLSNDARRRSMTADDFDDLIIEHLTIVPGNRYEFDSCCVDQNRVWQRAERAFTLLSQLIFVQPNLGEFYEEALRQFMEDGALYVEPRSLVFPSTDVDGNTYNETHYIHVYKQINDRFIRDNPQFIGSKIIKCDLRFFDVPTINTSINRVLEMRKMFPDFLAGYDLVGQEDKGIPLEQYLDALLRPSQLGVDLPYFFHAGETNWLDTVIDWNLLDAILLNSSRIGHGYSLVKHPYLLDLVKERDVAVEINPISNQVLGLITDLRNHPATYLLASNVSVVVSSDDPAIWRSLPLSHDYYQVFMANTGMRVGLRALKKLALNSIKYSSMESAQKVRAYRVFDHQWAQFIEGVIKDFS